MRPCSVNGRSSRTFARFSRHSTLTSAYSESLSGRDANVNEMIAEYLPQVRLIAYSMARKFKHIELAEDFVSYGTVGLIDAAAKYRNAQRTEFPIYASFRIRGAILDGLRAMDMLPRGMRRETKERGENPFIRDEGIWNDIPDPSFIDPLTRIQEQEVAWIVRRSVEKLPDQERRAVILHYYEDLSQSSVARVLGIDQGRVAQLLRQARLRLRMCSELWCLTP